MLFSSPKFALAPAYAHFEGFLHSIPKRFANEEGRIVYAGRNQLRAFSTDGLEVVVKAFRRPHFINRVAYGTLRASKAERSFRNASLLVENELPTPAPIGFIEYRTAGGILLGDSYYVSLASRCTHRYQELFEQNFPCADAVVRAVGRLTAQLHNKGLAHLDYGRGNILFLCQADGTVALDLVDVNRMRRGALTLEAGCRNLERLPATAHMHRLIAEEYASARGFDAEETYRLLRQFRSTQPAQIPGEF